MITYTPEDTLISCNYLLNNLLFNRLIVLNGEKMNNILEKRISYEFFQQNIILHIKILKSSQITLIRDQTAITETNAEHKNIIMNMLSSKNLI